MQQPKRILVRTPNWMGDHIMAQPFYEGLRRHYSNSHITFLCVDAVSGIEVGEWCNAKLTLNEKERHFSSAFLRLAARLRSEKYDLAMTLPATFSSALLPWCAGISHRVGFSGDGGQLFLTSYLEWKGVKSRQHKSSLYLELLELLTSESATKSPFSYSTTKKEKKIIIAPGASISLREWPYYRELLQHLSQQLPTHRILVVGAKREEKWHDLLKNISHVEDWIERTTLSELQKLCHSALLVIANDSGVAHLAATLAGAPTLVLFGPGDPIYVAPKGAKVSILRVAELSCSPCEKPYCAAPYGYQACLKQLSVEAVLNKALQMIAFDSKSLSS